MGQGVKIFWEVWPVTVFLYFSIQFVTLQLQENNGEKKVVYCMTDYFWSWEASSHHKECSCSQCSCKQLINTPRLRVGYD